MTARLIARAPPPAPSSASGMAAVHLTHPARCALEAAHLPLITCRITGRRCASSPPPPPGIHILCNQQGGGSVLGDLWVGISINLTYVTDKQALFSRTFPGKVPVFIKFRVGGNLFPWQFWWILTTRFFVPFDPTHSSLVSCGSNSKLNIRFRFDHFLFHLRSSDL